MKKGFISVSKAAEMSGYSRSGIYLWINSGREYFNVIKIAGRFFIEKKSFTRFLEGEAA